MIDHRSYTHNLSSCEIKAWKNSGPDGIQTHDTGAVLYQLSYQVIWELVTLWARNIHVEGEEFIWIYCVYNCDDQSQFHFFLRSSNIWSFIYSFEFFTFYGYITISQCDQLPDGLIAQAVEHCTGIAKVVGPNPFQGFFSGFNFNNCLSRVCKCNDQW